MIIAPGPGRQLEDEPWADGGARVRRCVPRSVLAAGPTAPWLSFRRRCRLSAVRDALGARTDILLGVQNIHTGSQGRIHRRELRVDGSGRRRAHCAGRPLGASPRLWRDGRGNGEKVRSRVSARAHPDAVRRREDRRARRRTRPTPSSCDNCARVSRQSSREQTLRMCSSRTNRYGRSAREGRPRPRTRRAVHARDSRGTRHAVRQRG